MATTKKTKKKSSKTSNSAKDKKLQKRINTLKKAKVDKVALAEITRRDNDFRL